ncbi:hypothetical protein, partial [Rhizobium johnstonii]|uniref:hypothetical protein n=1 Tax=Rhizobium johnstonii TaxID=3019933 RepID=UPI003F969DD0
VAGMAKATLGDRYGIDWEVMAGDYDLIRDNIEIVFPDFHDFNTRVKAPGGFRRTVAASVRVWHTSSGKAQHRQDDRRLCQQQVRTIE